MAEGRVTAIESIALRLHNGIAIGMTTDGGLALRRTMIDTGAHRVEIPTMICRSHDVVLTRSPKSRFSVLDSSTTNLFNGWKDRFRIVASA